MIILRIDDVGRKPSDTPEKGTDHDLSYFAEWRNKCGLIGLPVIYGVTPKWLNEDGFHWLKDNVCNDYTPESLAVHGYDHRFNAPVSLPQMIKGRTSLFDCLSYIPPFNLYDDKTIKDWADAGGKYFFGGMHVQHHTHGAHPRTIHGILHLPANCFLYGRAKELLEGIKSVRQKEKPVVATLHVPWEKDPSTVKELLEVIKPSLIPVCQLEGTKYGS